MASDKWTQRVSACPCGNGRIVADVESLDNPYSRASRQVRIDCPDCSKEWVLKFESELVNRASDEALTAAWHRLYEIDKQLEPSARQAIDEIFDKTPARTFTAERQVLTDARLCFKGPIVYSRERKAGASIGELCEPLKNLPWITSRTTNPTLAALVEEKSKLEASREQLRTQAKRIQVSSLPL